MTYMYTGCVYVRETSNDTYVHVHIHVHVQCSSLFRYIHIYVHVRGHVEVYTCMHVLACHTCIALGRLRISGMLH